MSLTFGIVGICFLLVPRGVIAFFDVLSPLVGMQPSGSAGPEFYTVLAVAYIYLVTLLTYMMYRHPERSILPLLLLNAKGASSLASLTYFIVVSQSLILLTNSIVDGTLAGLAYFLYRSSRGAH